MNRLFLALLALTAILASVNGHARLWDPVNRATAWRKFPNDFPRYDHDSHWCGVMDKKEWANNQKLTWLDNSRDVKCGIAGGVYKNGNNGPTSIGVGGQVISRYIDMYSFEYGATYYRGTIVKTYQKGTNITVEMEVTANHGGDVQFRLCEAGENGEDPDMQCFHDHPLKFKNGKVAVELNSVKPVMKTCLSCGGNKKTEFFKFIVQLPNKPCKHCILQMAWFNTQPGQVYVAASDIKIE